MLFYETVTERENKLVGILLECEGTFLFLRVQTVDDEFLPPNCLVIFSAVVIINISVIPQFSTHSAVLTGGRFEC